MLKFVSFLIIAVVALLAYNANSLTYTLIFSDEFDRPYFIDGGKWNVADRPSAVNNELQWYSWEDVFVENGFMYLRSRRRHVAGSGTTREYSSGMVFTKNKFSFLYGEVEWRAQLPKGKGLWPALWLVHSSCDPGTPCAIWPPEIDMMEARGDITNKITHAVHYGRYPHNNYVSTAFYGPDFTAGFHTFKVIWDPNQVVFFVDGAVTYKTTDKSIIPSEAMQLVMNVAVGGDYPGSPDGSTPFPSHMIIDWVRVYRWQ